MIFLPQNPELVARLEKIKIHLANEEYKRIDLGSGKITPMVQRERALLEARVPRFPFRVWERRGQKKGGEVWRVTSAPERPDRGDRSEVPPWEFGA